FIHATFGKDELPLTNEYDLLLSIFAGTISEYFLPFVKPKGYIVTTNNFSDEEYIKSKNFKLINTIRADKKNVYQSTTDKLSSNTKKSFNNNNGKYEFVDTLTYFLYQIE